MELNQVERIGWWCGLLAPVLIIAGFFSIDEGGTTPPGGPIASLVEEIVRSPGRIVAGSLVGMLGALMLMWFGSCLRTRLAREGDDRLVIALAAYGFTIVVVAGALLHGPFRLALTTVKDRAILGEAVRPLAILGSIGFGVVVWAMTGLVTTIGLAGFRTQLIPKPMAIIGILLSITAIAFSPSDHGGFGIALLPWLIIASALILRRDRTTSARVESGP